MGTALAIGSIELVIKFLIYYLHEKAWQLVPRGGISRLVYRLVPFLRSREPARQTAELQGITPQP